MRGRARGGEGRRAAEAAAAEAAAAGRARSPPAERRSVLSEAEQKAARDARYAARKARKK